MSKVSKSNFASFISKESGKSFENVLSDLNRIKVGPISPKFSSSSEIDTHSLAEKGFSKDSIARFVEKETGVNYFNTISSLNKIKIKK